VVKSLGHLSDAQLEQYGTDSFPGTSNDAPSIEAHLEDCADCRSRLLEHQRARFALQADSSMKASRQTGCVSEDDLRNLAAGIVPADEALAITQHVAQCPHCAPILRAFTEDFSDDLTADDSSTVSQLESSSPEWQKKLVKKLFPPK
jgi:hypothetical protein